MVRAESNRKRRMILSLWITLLAVMSVVVVAAIAGPLALNSYDRAHLTRIHCTVVSAEAGTASAGARVAASRPVVYIRTRDCGDLSLSWGVTRQNRDRIAAELAPGEHVGFDLGEGSRKLAGLLRALHLIPLVYGYHLDAAGPSAL